MIRLVSKTFNLFKDFKENMNAKFVHIKESPKINKKFFKLKGA
jgi:hypothetical protein